MRVLYEALDGKQFDSIDKARKHDKKVAIKAEARTVLLYKHEAFRGLNDVAKILFTVSHSFENDGNAKGWQKLYGTRQQVIDYLAVNQKYWFINTITVRKENVKDLDLYTQV